MAYRFCHARRRFYSIASKVVWQGAVEALEAATAIEKATAEFKVPATRPMT